MNLYDIKKELLDCVDLDTGEIIDIARFDDLQLEFDEKVDNIAAWYKNLLAEADALKHEKDSFAEREKKMRNKADSLKRYLSESLNGKKFSSLTTDISFRKSKSLVYDGVSTVPEQYLKYSDPTIDKSAITADIKSGAIIEGFNLQENNNIQIK